MLVWNEHFSLLVLIVRNEENSFVSLTATT